MFIEKLSPEQQRIDDAIFSVLSEEEIFVCCICKRRNELEYDKPYIISGNIKCSDFQQDVELKVCESCIIDILELDKSDDYL